LPDTLAVAQVAGSPRAPAPAGEGGRDSAGGVVEDGALIDRTAGRTAGQSAGQSPGQTAAIVRGAAIPPDTALHAAHPARLRFAEVRVVVAASSDLRWSAATRTLVLVRGSLDVDGAGGGVARVVTERFEVELGDVALTVDAGAVRVHRGRARIVDRERTLLAHVESGATWRSSVPSVAPAPAAAAHAAGPSATTLLADACSQLAAQDYAAAERTAERVLATSPSRGDAAEARIFLADLAQVSGALDRAVTRYLAVAAEFADLPVAESALYAAARVELRRSRTGAARAVLERYLARYPAGRYADDARRELAQP